MANENATNNTQSNEQDALVAIAHRNEFYRDSYRKVLLALNVSVGTFLVLLIALIYIVTHPPAPKYFATYADGKIVPLIPLNQPNVSDYALLQWANTAIIAVNTYDFYNYRDELQRASDYFTPEGWQAYLKELQQSGNLDAVIDKKLIVTAVATRAPIISQQGLIDGVYTWVVKAPILITYKSANQYNQQTLLVTLLIKRISTLTNPNGIGITNYIAAETNTSNIAGSNGNNNNTLASP